MDKLMFETECFPGIFILYYALSSNLTIQRRLINPSKKEIQDLLHSNRLDPRMKYSPWDVKALVAYYMSL